MKGFLNNRRVSCTLSALCFIALGVFLVFWPELSRIWICRLLGAALLVSGGVYVVSHFARAKGAAAVFQYDLILGAVLAVVGVWLLTTPDLIVAFLQYILGLILIVHGVIDLQGALNLRAGHARHWWPAFLIALITLALGALILWNPFASINALFRCSIRQRRMLSAKRADPMCRSHGDSRCRQLPRFACRRESAS